jgi:multidrug efflux pump subunit AcrA (membrane-fusion protein)
MKKLGWIAVATGLLMVGGWWTIDALTGEETEWVEADRDDLVLGVEIAGTLKSVETNLIGPPQLRHVWQFKIAQMAAEGEEVAAGTPVLAFDTSELQQQLQREIAERDAARKRVEKAEKELTVRRQHDLMRLGEAEARQRKAELKAASPDALEAAKDLALVKLDLELARKEVVYLQARLESAARSAEATLAALRDQLERAEQDVEETQRDIRQMTVVADRDGTVIYVTDWDDQKKKIGDSCWKGDHVIELPDLSRMKAMGMVHEADAGRVAEGQRVTLRLDAHPDVEFTGRVASIWRTVQRETWRSPKKVVRLEIALDETDTRRMRPGMRYRGTVEVDRVADALLVDADAIFLEPEGPVVYRRTLMGHEAVPVELGRRNERRVEVLRGLSEGDALSLTNLGEPRRAT